MKQATQQIKKSQKHISYTDMSFIGLFILSIVLARFWPLSGWSLVVLFAFIASLVLPFANYKDGLEMKPMLRAVAVGLALVGVRVMVLGGNYKFASVLMLLASGAIAGYLIKATKGNK